MSPYESKATIRPMRRCSMTALSAVWLTAKVMASRALVLDQVASTFTDPRRHRERSAAIHSLLRRWNAAALRASQ